MSGLGQVRIRLATLTRARNDPSAFLKPSTNAGFRGVHAILKKVIFAGEAG